VERAGTPRCFLDGFCGTGAVGLEMARRGARRVVAVDALRANCAILEGFSFQASGADPARIDSLMQALNRLPPRSGYISRNYGGTYFTVENCGRMDSAREEIERLRAGAEITREERAILLASFLLAADRVANTIGQYDAFLKHIDSPVRVKISARAGGRHLIDDRVRSPFLLQPLVALDGLRLEVMEGDMTALASAIGADVAYYDPPYNQRQYCDNYHVLENLARWTKPPLFGKTRKFDRTGLRSPFSRKATAGGALQALITATTAPDVFLSYSSEGILTREEILETLGARGTVEEIETAYPVFGNGAGVSVRRSVTERLFHLRMGR